MMSTKKTARIRPRDVGHALEFGKLWKARCLGDRSTLTRPSGTFAPLVPPREETQMSFSMSIG